MDRLAVICSHLSHATPRRLLRPWHAPSEGPRTSCPEIASAICASGACTSGGEGTAKESCCVFCKIVRGEEPAFKLYEDDICLCILDYKPLCCGHSLIIPRSHFSSLEETPPSVVAAMCSRVPFLSKAIMKATECDSFNLLVNSGIAAGQVVFHTHLHIIPRRGDDKLWTTMSLKRKSLDRNPDATTLADRIRTNLSVSADDNTATEELKLGESSQS